MVLCVIGAQSHAREFEFQKEIDALYLEREGAPLWLDGERLNQNGEQLYRHLQNAWHHGLNPVNYNMNHENLEPLQKELLLTQGFIKYARDLSGVRVKPSNIKIDPNHWKRRISAKDVLRSLNENQKPFSEFLNSLSPQTQTYQVLSNEMAINPSLQLALNMERLRWLPEEKPERFIIVNIPSARLWAIEKGQAKLEMPVIVGRKDRATPSFIVDSIGVRFNPTWTIPPTIKEKDIWPKLKENPYYLIDKKVEIFEGDQTLDPSIVDWNEISRQELHQFRMVQLPGPANPLGKVRILMPNKYSIFLHDTIESGFHGHERSYSSGCVRLQKPEKVAEFILQKNVKTYMQSNETQDVLTKSRVPIQILYHTVWLGAGQNIIYGEDIYGYDKTLEKALRKNKALPEGI